MTTTVTTLRQAAPAPRLDVDRPPFAPRLVLEVFSTPPEILSCAKEPDMDRQCIPAELCKNRMLTTQPTDGKIKAPPSGWGDTRLVGLRLLGLGAEAPAVASTAKFQRFQCP